MKKLIATLSVFYVSIIFAFSQEKYEPSIVILAPNETVVEDFLKEEVKQWNNRISKRASALKNKPQPDLSGKAENVKIMVGKSIEMQLISDFYLTATNTLTDYLSYAFFEKFPNCLIYPMNVKMDNDPVKLSKIAQDARVQYVVNLSKMHFYGQDKVKFAKLSICLFDSKEKKCVLEKTYIGDMENRGGAFACEEGTVFCTMNNAISAAAMDIIKIVYAKNPTIQKENALFVERSKTLIEKYYLPKTAPELPKIIEANYAQPNLGAYYQGITNKGKDKFVAFFLEEKKNQDAQSTYYAYTLLGVSQQNKWYIIKDNELSFQEKNMELAKRMFFNLLQQWNFFEEGNASLNPKFWETDFFGKIEKQDEKESVNYVGQYEIVAIVLRQEQKKAIEAFEKDINVKTIIPFFSKIKTAQPDVFAKIEGLNKKFPMIYPTDKSYFICPVMVTNAEDEKTLRFFFFDLKTNKQYEWIYFEEKKIENNAANYASEVVYVIEKLTKWNWTYENLNNANFWTQYVLAKENDNYKYLQEF